MRLSIVLSAFIVSSAALSIRQNDPGMGLLSKRQDENHDGGHAAAEDPSAHASTPPADHPQTTDSHSGNDNPAQHNASPSDDSSNHNAQPGNDNTASHAGEPATNSPTSHDTTHTDDDSNDHANTPATNGTSNHDSTHTPGDDTTHTTPATNGTETDGGHTDDTHGTPATNSTSSHTDDSHGTPGTNSTSSHTDDSTSHGTPGTNGTTSTIDDSAVPLTNSTAQPGDSVKLDPSDKCNPVCRQWEIISTSCHASNVDSLACYCRAENLGAAENCASCRLQNAGNDRQAQTDAQQYGATYFSIRDQCIQSGTKVIGTPKVTVTATTSVNIAQFTVPATIVKTIVVKGGGGSSNPSSKPSSNSSSKDQCSSECKKSKKVYDSCPKDKNAAGCWCKAKNLKSLEDCAACRKKNVGNDQQANSTANALIDQFIGIRQLCIESGTKVSTGSLKVTATTTISVNPAQVTAPTGIVRRWLLF